MLILAQLTAAGLALTVSMLSKGETPEIYTVFISMHINVSI